MKWMKNITLFLLLVILAAYVYFYEIKGGEKREQEKRQSEQVFQFETDSVKFLEVRSVLAHFVFQRDGEQWRILKPVVTEAEKGTINSALSTLKNLKKEREFPVPENDLITYGLVGTSTLVILELTNGERDSIRFGDDTPVGSNVYANKVDTVVFMIPSYAKRNFIKTLFDWRDKTVCGVKQSEVKEFDLQNPHGLFRLVKEDNNWQLISPLQTRADNSTVGSILNKMEFGKAVAVVSESLEKPAQFRLNKPVYQLDMLIGESKAKKSVIFSELKDNVAYGKDMSRPQVFSVDSLYIKEINKSLFQLRYKKIAEYDRDHADSVVVRQDDSLYVFTKDTSSTWSLSGNRKVKNWKMNSLLNTLNSLSAKKFLQENVATTDRYGLSNPERKVTVYRRGEKILEVLLSAPKADLKVAFSPNSGIVAEIEDSAYNNMKVEVSEFIDNSVQIEPETD